MSQKFSAMENPPIQGFFITFPPRWSRLLLAADIVFDFHSNISYQMISQAAVARALNRHLQVTLT
jgi:hypothetical protein